MHIRNLSVSYLPGPFPADIPYIRLKGRWLADAGFNPGDSLQVRVEYARITVAKLTESGQIAEPGVNPGEFAFMAEIGTRGGERETEEGD